MAVHITIYPDEPVAAELRRFMAAHACSATKAVELLLAHVAATEQVTVRLRPDARRTQRTAVA